MCPVNCFVAKGHWHKMHTLMLQKNTSTTPKCLHCQCIFLIVMVCRFCILNNYYIWSTKHNPVSVIFPSTHILKNEKNHVYEYIDWHVSSFCLELDEDNSVD